MRRVLPSRLFLLRLAAAAAAAVDATATAAAVSAGSSSRSKSESEAARWLTLLRKSLEESNRNAFCKIKCFLWTVNIHTYIPVHV